MNIYALCDIKDDEWWCVEHAHQHGPTVVLTIAIFNDTGWGDPLRTVKVEMTDASIYHERPRNPNHRPVLKQSAQPAI